MVLNQERSERKTVDTRDSAGIVVGVSRADG
jgi:hypothetical protein